MSKNGRLLKAIRHAGYSDIVRVCLKTMGVDGGPGSGNFGHAGRPGKVGGSAPEGSASFSSEKVYDAIASKARSAPNYRAFINKMNKDQKDELRKQREACGTQESMQKYAERIYNMLHSTPYKSDVRQESKPVDGKDISDTWKSKYANNSSDESTKEIDTDIEDVLHIQGFDGLPKIVSQTKFDEIIKEHPEMPVLFRSYAAPNKAMLDEYDNDLENGFFYVDCSTGGAGFGQGMYAAGVYEHEPKPYRDCDFDLYGKQYVTDDKGRAFEVSYTTYDMGNFVLRDPDEGDRYILEKKNGEIQMLEAVELEEYGMCWVNMNTNQIYEDELWLNSDYEGFRELDEVTEKGAQKGIFRGAIEEMEHYRRININKIKQSARYITPDGKDSIGEYYFDPNSGKRFDKDMPEEGQRVAVWFNDDPYTKSLWTLKKQDGKYYLESDMSPSIDLDKDTAYRLSWAPIEGKCEEKDISPEASTRMMTLDPSAKIVKFQDLKQLVNKGEYIRRDFRDQQGKELREFLEKIPFEDAWCESKMYYVMRGEGTGDLTPEQIKRIVDYKKSHPERMNMLMEFTEKQKAASDKMKEEAEKYDRLRGLDYGVAAAVLGYDAINADGHGESGSYTVVLNRTKLIISEDRYDVR